MAVDYEKAGVSLEAGYDVVRRIKKHVASTSRLGVMGNIGSFGGMFDLSALNIEEPILRERNRRCRNQTQTRIRDGQA